MNLSNSSFSFRDYLAYLFPGLMVMAAYFLFVPHVWEFLSKEKLLAGIALLVAGYFLGYISNVLSTRTIAVLTKKLLGNPFKTTLSDPEANGFDQKRGRYP